MSGVKPLGSALLGRATIIRPVLDTLQFSMGTTLVCIRGKRMDQDP